MMKSTFTSDWIERERRADRGAEESAQPRESVLAVRVLHKVRHYFSTIGI